MDTKKVMATDTPHKLEFRIRDLSTRSVLLFPSRAQVIRDIKNIILQPGTNQIIIDGLTPLVDEHSIKVEGTGSATITDPEDSEEEDDESEPENYDVEVEESNTINEKIKELVDRTLDEQEKINSAADRLKICDNFSKSVEKNPPAAADLEELIEAYHTERKKIYRNHEAAAGAMQEMQQELRKIEKAKLKLAKAIVKANEKAGKEKAKERVKKMRQMVETAKEKQRVKWEREYFWPQKIYRITINLESSSLTPASSRRSSMDGDIIVNLAASDFHKASDAPLKADETSLSLQYITHGASWAPRYDLNLNTVKSTGLLEYGAEIRNTTIETWRDTKVILSTSQTTFSGLSETIPTLLPWHVRLQNNDRVKDDSLFSSHKLAAKHITESKNKQSLKPRWELFGRDNSGRNAYLADQEQQLARKEGLRSRHAQVLMSQNQPRAMMSQPMPLVIGNSQAFRPPTYAARRYHSSEERYGAVRCKKKPREETDTRAAYDDHGSSDDGFGIMDDEPCAPQSLTFEEGAWEETGMTTTYDVPGTKTLSPNNSTIKHKIAKIDFKKVVFSHMVIGKLRQVAFLKARLRNNSKITLLKGPLGLTLDGSFLGQAVFPRCSAGESFSLPLGVDPALNIAYHKLTVRRSQTGLFTKEECNVFSRAVIIINTKHNAVVEVTVLDQIPVSEDERLKIEIANPKGLKVGGDSVKAGTSVFNIPATAISSGGTVRGDGSAKEVRASVYGVNGDGKDTANKKWGSAVASVKKGGEITWSVKLNPGQGVRLASEYEATYRGGEKVVGI
ncbi:uncharacterized protein RSE6_01927 [Rhynchosporium secalis]|uniref:Mucoidy inhibitor A n=1 Tax=Rhynchosporium secalis TaxID=38038 RepID=A0A1E1LZ06_RHYSE|nr:uncharacterized protein RSE6_01927 [Rhynchosporium secalis]